MGLRLNTLPPNSLLVKINVKNVLENIFVYDRNPQHNVNISHYHLLIKQTSQDKM